MVEELPAFKGNALTGVVHTLAEVVLDTKHRIAIVPFFFFFFFLSGLLCRTSTWPCYTLHSVHYGDEEGEGGSIESMLRGDEDQSGNRQGGAQITNPYTSLCRGSKVAARFLGQDSRSK